MKMPTIRLQKTRFTALLVTIFTVLFIAACGDSVGDSDDDPINNATVAITPAEVALTVGDLMGNCFAVDTGFNNDQVVQVSVRNANNDPLGGENILAIIDFGENNSQLVTVTQLWRDVNDNQVIDAGDELSNDSGDGALDLKTDSNGIARFIVRYSAGCTFRANLLILTDSDASGLISIEVTDS